MSRIVRVGSLALLFILAGPTALAELPDAEVNGVTGDIESVDAAFANTYKVRHVIDPGQGGVRTSVSLSDHPATSPRIAVDSTGDSWVVWWQDTATDRVYFRRHDLVDEAWTAQKAISLPLEQSAYPEIVHDGDAAWVVFQIDNGIDTDVGVLSIVDSPDPIPARVIVGTSLSLGDIDVRIHTESGELWVTWVDDSDDVGWVEYDDGSETWSTALYESYSGSDVETARSAIRDSVLGL